MYTHYYQLKAKAFESRPKPAFIWLGKSRKVVVDVIGDGILVNNGFHLLTGSEGVGKSVLLHKTLMKISKKTHIVLMRNVLQSSLEFYNEIAAGFGLERHIESKVQFVIELGKLLRDITIQGKIPLLVIDNAHRLSDENLEDIRMLLALDKEEKQLLNVLLVGREELSARLTLPVHKILLQNLACHAQIKPLNLQEIREYVTHRLTAAKAPRPIFDETAFASLLLYSGGLPGLINTFCTSILEEGAQQKETVIDAGFIDWMFGNRKALKEQAAPQLPKTSLLSPQQEEHREGVELFSKGVEKNRLEKSIDQSIDETQNFDDAFNSRIEKIGSFQLSEEEEDDGLTLPPSYRAATENDDIDDAQFDIQGIHERERAKRVPYKTNEQITQKKKKKKSKLGLLFVRGAVALAVCCALYFLYQQLTAAAIKTTPKKVNKIQAQKDNKTVPLVIPDNIPPENLVYGTRLNQIPVNGKNSIGVPEDGNQGTITIQPLLIVE